jgi:hypothetical protein
MAKANSTSDKPNANDFDAFDFNSIKTNALIKGMIMSKSVNIVLDK